MLHVLLFVAEEAYPSPFVTWDVRPVFAYVVGADTFLFAFACHVCADGVPFFILS